MPAGQLKPLNNMIEQVYMREKAFGCADWSPAIECTAEVVFDYFFRDKRFYETLIQVNAVGKSEYVTFHLRTNGVCTVYDCTDLELLNAFWTRLISGQR